MFCNRSEVLNKNKRSLHVRRCCRSVCCSKLKLCSTRNYSEETSEKPKNIIIMNIGLVSTLIPVWDTHFFFSFLFSLISLRTVGTNRTEQSVPIDFVESVRTLGWGFRLVRVPRGSMRLWLFDIFSFPNKHKSIAWWAFSFSRWQTSIESMQTSNNDFYRR